MDHGGLKDALERAEQALGRIEKAALQHKPEGRDEKLREKVRQAVAELDELIHSAGR